MSVIFRTSLSDGFTSRIVHVGFMEEKTPTCVRILVITRFILRVFMPLLVRAHLFL